MFLLHKSWLRSDLMWQKVNVFLFTNWWNSPRETPNTVLWKQKGHFEGVCTYIWSLKWRASGWRTWQRPPAVLTQMRRLSECWSCVKSTQTRMHPQNIFWAGYIPFYQFWAVQPSTPGSTRPLGSLWSCSHLHPHTPRPHKTPSPYHIYRLDMALGSISDCWSRLCHPLYRNLYEKEQQLKSVPRSIFGSW